MCVFLSYGCWQCLATQVLQSLSLPGYPADSIELHISWDKQKLNRLSEIGEERPRCRGWTSVLPSTCFPY